MSYDLYTGNPDDEQALVAYLMQLHSYARSNRVNFEVQWEESASICWPEYRNSFSFGHVRAPGVKYTQFQIDSHGAICSHRFMAICDAIITPFNSVWSVIEADDPYLMKQRAAKEYFEEWTRILWAERYKYIANFYGQNQQNLQCLGVFGNHGMWIDELDRRPGNVPAGLRYMANSPGEIYRLQNHQGREDGCIRHFRWTARQAAQRWPQIATDEKYTALKAALEKGDTFTRFDFLQFVIPRTDYDPHKIFSDQGKPWASIYVSIVGYCVLEQSGYYEYPRAGGLYMQAPEEDYGRGPAQICLPDLKTENSAMEAYLKTGVAAGDPTYLLPEDGLFDFKATAGAYVYGGMNEQGKRLVDIMPTGQIQITDEILGRVGKKVDDAFLTSLFPLLFDNKGPQRSAREVVEWAVQQGVFLSPLARQYTEYCGPLVDREIGILSRMRKGPKTVPGVVREAYPGGDIRTNTKFTSPLAQALDMPAVAGFMRMVEMGTQISQAMGGDKSVFYNLNFNRAFPGMATNQRVPVEWLSTPAEIAQQQKAAAAEQQREQEVQSLPGKAAIMKAQAISDKAQAGQNIGGALSGTPPGGMPLMPGGGGQ